MRGLSVCRLSHSCIKAFDVFGRRLARAQFAAATHLTRVNAGQWRYQLVSMTDGLRSLCDSHELFPDKQQSPTDGRDGQTSGR